MASSTFALEGGHVANSSNSSASYSSPTARHLNRNPTLNKTTYGNGDNNNNNNKDNTTLHAHRQNHNSSKLPAFRFADLKKEALSLPGLLQQNAPPSPLSPSTISGHCSPEESADNRHDPDSHDSHKQCQQSLQIAVSPRQNNLHSAKTAASPASNPSAPVISQHPQSSPSRNRASTFQDSSSPNSRTVPLTARRPASFPDSPAVVVKINGHDLPSSSLGSTRSRAEESGQASPTADNTKDWAQGQRELLLPKSIDSAKTDEKKKSRPPVSFRAPNIPGSSGRAVIPPIRSFRSSGSRKSLVLDMHARRTSYDSGEEADDPHHRDRTLRALEGRSDDDFSQITPPDSAGAMSGNENTADIFMRIASENPAHRVNDGMGSAEDHSAVSRITRSTRTRPLSAAIPSYQASPPQISRRLSDQRENTRNRRTADDRSAQQMTRELNYRGIPKDQPTTNSQIGEGSNRSQLARVSLRPSPITPRTLTFQEPFADGSSAYSQRRPSLTDSNSGLASRTSQYRTPNLLYGQGRTYNSSPLAARSSDPQRQDAQQAPEASHGLEGTESSASTAAPSTVWDELDDLKSRIYRLELTGKAPSTSGAAMSRVSDERPPTATTNATTMSASPKRGSGTSAAQADASSTTSSQREAQPILRSALSKTKGFVSLDVYSAIELAATEALALSSMMGTPGQLGPISSGASTIGAGGSVTDRQLRRKAESICRSLTELCLALTESSSQSKLPQGNSTPREQDAVASPTVTSPTVTKFSTGVNQRRPSITDQPPTRVNSSPRAGTSLEQRRTTLLVSAALPSPRFAAGPGTPTDVGRKSSLMLARTRRGGTEEPEEPSGRKSSLLLRTRRAATEEPEEGRKTSLLHVRRGTNDDDEDEEARFRAPSRAATEVNGLRTAPREYPAPGPAPEGTALGSSALPRRRFASSTLSFRPTGPSAATGPASPAGRRYLDRSMPERETNSVMEKLAEDRGQRQLSLSQTAMLNRTGSMSRRRNSGIPSLPSASMQAGSYR